MAGNAVIGALRVNLGIDTAAFDKGLKGAQGTLSRVGQMMKAAFVAAAAAAVSALAGIGVAIRGIINDADELSKTAAKIGIPIEELSRLKYAADLSGVAMGQLQTGVQRLSRNMSDAAQGTGEGAEAFKMLGINVKDADGNLKSATSIMGEIGDKFASMPDGAQKTALAMDLMGRSGADLIPMLNGGSAALKELTDEADAFGLTISAETGKRAEAFNDNLARIGYAAQGVTTALASALLPALVVVSEALVAAARGLVEMLTYLPTVAEYGAVAGGSLALMISPQIIAAIYGAATALGTALVGALRAVAVAAAANPLGALVVALTVAITAVYHFRDEIKQAIGVDVVGVFRTAVNAIIGTFVRLLRSIKKVVAGIKSAVADAKSAILSLGVSQAGAGSANADPLQPIMPGDANAASVSPAPASVETSPTLSEDLSRDYISEITNLFDSGSESASNFTRSAEDAAAAVSGAGGVGEKMSKAAKEAAAAMNKLKQEGQSVFETTRTPLEKYNMELERLGRLLKAGAIDQDTFARASAAAKKSLDEAQGSMGKLGDIGQNISQTISSSFKGLIDGSKKLKDVLKDVVSNLADMMLNNAFQIFFGGGATGGGGLFSGLLGGFGKLLGFANGGSFQVGGAGGIDSQLVAFRASPNETVSITKPGQDGGGDGGRVAVEVMPSEYFDVRVRSISRETAAAAAPAILGQAKAQVVPTMASFQNDRAGSDYRL